MGKTCIRVYADLNQIRAGREELEATGTAIDRLAGVLNLAGSAVRFRMLYLIYLEGELCPCDLSDILGMTVPAVSQHLRKLKDGGLLALNRVGQTIFYRLVPENTAVLHPLFDQVRQHKETVKSNA